MKLLISAIMAFGSLCPADEWISPHPLETELNAPVALLPFPSEVVWKKGTCPTGTKITIQKVAAETEEYGKEGYSIDITPAQITVKASGPAGVFYAKQTLAQLEAKGAYPCCSIKDAPAFAVRGFMHDVGRNFRTIDSLKEQLNEMAKFKINTFQWHLTDYPAWRIECKKYPVLNDPSKRQKDRDIDGTYSYKEIRELFKFAADRHIRIIPEIDMPGHSTYFKTCFGVDMHSEKGMQILEELLDEFCSEIPWGICPYIHIGADEVRIPNAKEFIKRMSGKLAEHGRTPLQWNGPHDLPVGEQSIAQAWADENNTAMLSPDRFNGPYIDSTAGYMNALDPALLVRRYFFRQPCGVVKGNEKSLGVIACLFPDVRVDDKAKIPWQNAQWPGILAIAERTWKGMPVNGAQYPGNLPPPDTEAWKAFALFEKRMEAFIGNKPFPYWRDTFMTWQVTTPHPSAQKEEIRTALLSGKTDNLEMKTAIGGNLYFKSRAAKEGLYNKQNPGVTVWAETTLYADRDRTIHAMIGFDAPGRATRRTSGMPEAGEWSQCETKIWLNGKEFKNPQTYKLAGQRRYTKHTWFTPANELPFDNEEFWWARAPIAIPLKKGENRLIIEQPYTGDFQSWGISFIPVKKQGNTWIADASVVKP